MAVGEEQHGGVAEEYAKADAASSALGKEEEALQKRLQAISAEIDTLAARATARDDTLRIARGNVERLRQDSAAGRAHATMAQGTSLSAEADTQQKHREKHLQGQERELATLEARTESERSEDDGTKSSLDKWG